MDMKIKSSPFSFEYGLFHITVNTTDDDKLKVEVHPMDNPKESKTFVLDGDNPDIEQILE